MATMRWSKWVACLLVTVLVQLSVSSRTPDEENTPTISFLRGARGPLKASMLKVRPYGILAQQQQQPEPAEPGTNYVYSVDYSEEGGSPYTTDEADERAMEQVMTYSTYFPDMQMQQQHTGKPCHHHQHQQQHMQLWQIAHQQHITAAAAAAPAAAVAADVDVLEAAADHAWHKAQQVAARLAAADAEETAELVAELEAAMDKLTAAEHTASAVIDRRWGRSDHRLDGSLWSELVADYINPARRYFSGMDDYILSDVSSSYGSDSSSRQAEDEFPDYEDSLGLLPADPVQLLSTPQHSPAGVPAGHHAGQHDVAAHDNIDIGLLILQEDNAANNLALFGVRTPAEVAAAATAAAAEGAEAEEPWSSFLEWLSASPYLSPFDNVNPQQAAAVLLVGFTLVVFIAFLFSIVDLRAAVQSAAAAAAAGNSSSQRSRSARMPAGAVPLRTRKSAFGCSAVATAAAAVAMACGSGGQGSAAVVDLSQPLLFDAADDVEAAVVQAQPSAVLAPSLQKFYNPMHYQQLPDSE